MVNFKFFKPLVLLAFLIPIFPVSVDDGGYSGSLQNEM